MSIVDKLLRKESSYVIARVSLRSETAEKFQKFVRITHLQPEHVAATIMDEVFATDAGINALLTKGSKEVPGRSAVVKKPVRMQRGAKVLAPMPENKASAAKTKPAIGPAQRLALQVASLKRLVVGKVYAEFNERFAGKIKGLGLEQVRSLRLKWLKHELARLRRKSA